MRLAILALGAVLVWPTAALATTYLVRPDGSGDFPTIQAAVDAAVNDDEIVLTNGTFRGPGNRDVNYLGKEIVVRSQSGDPEACVIDCEGSPGERHRGFFIQGVGHGALEGVTITRGTEQDGGGIWLMSSSLSILNCVFSESEAYQGAGIYCDGWSQPTIDGCTFTGNRSGSAFCI
jgi:hypothetical protein